MIYLLELEQVADEFKRAREERDAAGLALSMARTADEHARARREHRERNRRVDELKRRFIEVAARRRAAR
jgi:hypothetical protein